jgi:hypothetical protein
MLDFGAPVFSNLIESSSVSLGNCHNLVPLKLRCAALTFTNCLVKPWLIHRSAGDVLKNIFDVKDKHVYPFKNSLLFRKSCRKLLQNSLPSMSLIF